MGRAEKQYRRIKDLNAWHVNMDAFGVLVMMAATSLSLQYIMRRILASEKYRDDEL